MQIRIVEYREDYFEEVVELMRDLQEHERKHSELRTQGDEMAEGHFRYLLALCEARQGKAFLALKGETPAGFVVVILDELEKGDLHVCLEHRKFGLITDLYVSPAFRSSGIGEKLLLAAEEHCGLFGVGSVSLHALCANQVARRFYEKRGYSPHEIIYRKEIQ